MSQPNRSTGGTFNALGKINDQNLPPASTALDWDNPSLAQGICDVAAIGLTNPRIWCRLTLSTTTGGLILLASWAVWSNATSIPVTLARTTTGVFTITTPATVSDEYDASFNITNNISVSLSAAHASAEGSTPCFINASASGNVITLHTFNSSGSANDLSGSNIVVVAY
jgi:hypothetical protein